jgi:stage V sporulation protein B
MRRSFVKSAIILIFAGLIVRLLGFVYRIYLSNLIGAEGMGLYQLVLPVYTAIVLTITSGISIAVSKIIAQQRAGIQSRNTIRITSYAMLLVAVAGILVSVVIFFNARSISDKILGDSRTYYSLILMAPCLPAVVAASALKGYFYGIQQVTPTALSQVAEQVVKIGFVLILARGVALKNVEIACAIATLSAALGEIVNLAVLAAVYAYKKKRVMSGVPKQRLMSKRAIVSQLLKISVPVSANRLIVSILSAAEHIMIPAMLVLGGLDRKTGMEIFGRLTGMALPLIMFPSLVTNSLATTLVPAISESVSRKSYMVLNERISKSVHGTIILGMIFTAILLSYPEQIGNLVYPREKIDDILYMLSFSCVFIYLQQTLTGVMNGLGKQGVLLRNTVIGSILRIGAIYFLMPAYGVNSYAWCLSGSFALISLIDLLAINKITGLVIDFRNWFVKPGVIVAAMVLIGKYIYYFFDIFQLGDNVTILITLPTYMLISFILMVLFGVLKFSDLSDMFGTNIIKFKRKTEH